MRTIGQVSNKGMRTIGGEHKQARVTKVQNSTWKSFRVWMANIFSLHCCAT